MGRPKIKKSQHKISLTITLSVETYELLSSATNNKSGFIEKVLKEKLKNEEK